MIIYELTNKKSNSEIELFFSKYYATKDEAVKSKRDDTKVFKHELRSLSRDEIAMILSMGHVDVFYEKGWNELHDISSLAKSTKEVL